MESHLLCCSQGVMKVSLSNVLTGVLSAKRKVSKKEKFLYTSKGNNGQEKPWTYPRVDRLTVGEKKEQKSQSFLLSPSQL